VSRNQFTIPRDNYPAASNRTPDETNPRLLRIELSIRQLSTCKPHPLCKTPDIFLHHSDGRRPTANLEIVGAHLVLIVTYQLSFLDMLMGTAQREDKMYIFNWKTGDLKLVCPRINN
jgi:hypothetical protein